MRRLLAVAVAMAGLALPVCAQRGGSHGGFSGHGAAGFHGGSGGRLAGRMASSAAAGGRFVGRPSTFSRASGMNRYRAPYSGEWGTRRPYRSPYRAGYTSIYPGWVAPYYVGYPYDFGEDDAGVQQNNAGGGYDLQPDEQGPPYAEYPPYPPYPAQAVEPQGQAPVPENEDAVTLVFKDGRAPEQIHNYVLTSKTLYVGDQHRREIPVDELDLTATAKVNREAGVDFNLPNTSN